jgi:peptidoglycan/xylan/chitin deacetylase (PgdA/CDA1 family)
MKRTFLVSTVVYILFTLVLSAAIADTPSAKPDVSANELGRIPILMYHSIGEYHTPYDRHGLNITPATFRKQMELLHKNGFYPVNLRDLLDPHLEIPEGKTPVVITFDDARGSQIRYKNGALDPDCAVGILETMHKKYGDTWPQRAVFFVLPYSKYNPTPFRQPREDKAKVHYLVQAGYEIANHSTSHRPLDRLNAQELKWEVTNCQQFFKKLDPNVTMDTMAVPYGIFPKTHALREVLIQNGNKLICMAWGDASYAPFDKRFNPAAVMRIGSEPGNIERWIKALVAARYHPASSIAPYVSDGDPDVLTVPESRAKYVNQSELSGIRLVTFADAPPLTAAKHKKATTIKAKSSHVNKPIQSASSR